MTDVKWAPLRGIKIFGELSQKLASFAHTKRDEDKKLLKALLRKINSLDLGSPCFESSNVNVSIIRKCCTLILPEDEDLVLLAAKLFVSLLTKQQLSFDPDSLSLVVFWCTQCLKYTTNVTVLKCLEILTKGCDIKPEVQLFALLIEIKRIFNDFGVKASDTADSESLLFCLKCIQNIVFPCESVKENGLSPNIFNDCFEILKEFLFNEKYEKNMDKINHCKSLIATFKGIGNLLELSDYVRNAYIHDILGMVKGYMMFGLPGDAGYKKERVLPAQLSVPDIFKHSGEEKKLKGKYDKKAKKIPVTSIASIGENEALLRNDVPEGFGDDNEGDGPNINSLKTSDSDNSEDENAQSSKITMYESKVRQCAFIVLGLMVKKTGPKLFAGYLPIFLPDGPQIPHVRTLITCLLTDSSPSCRAEIVGILSMIISNSKPYFLLGDNASRTSFTTFSGTVGNIIKELHRSLALALIAENSVTIITRLLKCMSELIRCSPYNKLEPGIITRLSRHVRGFMNHRDINVQVAALSVFGTIASVGPQVSEVRDIIMRPMNEEENESDDEDGAGKSNVPPNGDGQEGEERKSWIFELCLRNITRDNADGTPTNPALLVESLEVIGALVRNFFQETVVSYPTDILNVLQICIDKSEYLVQLYGGKLLVTVLNSLQFSLSLEDELLRAPISLVSQIWETVLPGPITTLIRTKTEPMLKCTGCNAISNISVLVLNENQSFQKNFIYDLIPGKLRVLCFTLLLECAVDEAPIVKSSALRALSLIVLFPSLMEDTLFVFDTAEAVSEAALDGNSSVRYQSSCLVRNLTESIFYNHDREFQPDVSEEAILKLLETSIILSDDNAKVKPGALRAIGNVMRIVNDSDIMNHKHSVIKGLHLLIKNAASAKFVKTRWNSCYAIAHALTNVLTYNFNDITTKIFTTLMNLMQNYKNFKVRISAAFALCSPPERFCFGDQYSDIWSSTLQAIENAKNVCHINEYQHRDQLIDQLACVMVHLLTVIETKDLIPVQDLILNHLDNVKSCLTKFQENIVPEKANITLKAIDRLHNLLQVWNLSAEDKSAIHMLEGLLN